MRPGSKKGRDVLQDKPEQSARRQAIWRHNGLFGSVKLAQSTMHSINAASTCTDESKRLAQEVQVLLYQLATSLLTRKDQQK